MCVSYEPLGGAVMERRHCPCFHEAYIPEGKDSIQPVPTHTRVHKINSDCGKCCEELTAPTWAGCGLQ